MKYIGGDMQITPPNLVNLYFHYDKLKNIRQKNKKVEIIR